MGTQRGDDIASGAARLQQAAGLNLREEGGQVIAKRVECGIAAFSQRWRMALPSERKYLKELAPE